MRDKPHLWKWFEDVLIPATFASEWYNGQKETITEYTGNKRTILIGMPRLRQLRVLKGRYKLIHLSPHLSATTSNLPPLGRKRGEEAPDARRLALGKKLRNWVAGCPV